MARINEKARLATLSISQWRATKHDQRVTEEAGANHGTTPDWGRYSKFLVDRDEVKAIAQIANEARSYHCSHTLPWDDNGTRILTAAMFPEYTAAIQGFVGRFKDAVEKFVDAYPAIVRTSQMKLNGLFDENDYPTVERLRKKFGFDVKFFPLPDKEDFRVRLSEDEVIEIQRNIEENTQAVITGAIKDLHLRLHEVISRMVERLSDKEAVFRDSLVGNVANLCALLPKLNLTNDPQLDQLTKEVEEKLTKYDPETLRKDDQARKDTADKADEILKKIQEVVG